MLHTAKTALDSKFYWFPYFCMTNNELKKWIGMFCSRYHGFVSWPCPSYVPELWCQNCTFYSGCWAVLWCGSSTGYGTPGTHGARGGRYVHLQHSAATWPEQIQIVQAAICSDCTFYAIWCWMCLHKVAAGGWMLQQRPALAGSPNITLLNRKTAGNSFYWNCSRCIVTIHQFNGGLWYLVYPANHSPKIPLFVNLMTRKHYNLLLKTINGIEYTKKNKYYVESRVESPVYEPPPILSVLKVLKVQ